MIFRRRPESHSELRCSRQQTFLRHDECRLEGGISRKWNIYLEREVGKSLLLRQGHVGNHAVGLAPCYRDSNAPPPGPVDFVGAIFPELQ
jgi:hypothetical protein